MSHPYYLMIYHLKFMKLSYDLNGNLISSQDLLSSTLGAMEDTDEH